METNSNYEKRQWLIIDEIYIAEVIFIYIIPKSFMLIVKWNTIFRGFERINTPTNRKIYMYLNFYELYSLHSRLFVLK